MVVITLVLLMFCSFILNNYKVVWTVESKCHYPDFIQHSPDSIWMTNYGLINASYQDFQSIFHNNNNKNNNKNENMLLSHLLKLPKELYNDKLNLQNLQYGWLQMAFKKDSHNAWLFFSCYHILYAKDLIYFTTLRDLFLEVCSTQGYKTYKSATHRSSSSGNAHEESSNKYARDSYTNWLDTTTYISSVSSSSTTSNSPGTVGQNSLNSMNNYANDNSSNNEYPSAVGYLTMSCSWQFDKNLYLIQYTNFIQRSVYQCVKFEAMNEYDSATVFNLFFSKFVSSTPDADLCHPEAFISKPTKWVAVLPLNSGPGTKTCPISGGFQISQTVDLMTHKVLCESEIYGVMESECISGEGITLKFSQSDCNPFFKSDKAEFQCHSTWKKNNLNYILIYQEINQFNYDFYQLVYMQLPAELSAESTTYGQFSPIWIIHGLQSDKTIEETIISRIYLWNSLEWYNLKSRRTTLHNSSANIYEMGIRRAFGNCDDERISCKYGCEYSARNQLFCHRSCSVPRQTCEYLLHDSCKFHSNYHGIWELIEPVTTQTSVIYSNSSSRLTARFHINNNKLIINSVNDVQHSMHFYCIREIQESLIDRYVLRSDHQSNGCHSRSLCLEIYRGSKSEFDESSSINSILYRMSVSEKHLISDTCQFDKQKIKYSSSGSSTIHPLNANILVRNMNQESNPHIPTNISTKCGLYQIKLTGLLYIMSSKPEHYNVQPLSFISVDKSIISNRVTDQTYANTPTNITAKIWKPNEAEYNANFEGPCPTEISDFNSHYGVTGEFDNILRIRNYCTIHKYSTVFKSDHQCIASSV
uniref:Uncharacterized protein n=1 Tax=Trichobilharzia regenti TaxID=157069 RepID=A0AA85IR44_TRIRE|nr:unnamed protein product [Trichobilharzia regenti]